MRPIGNTIFEGTEERVHSSGHKVGKISVREVVANVQHLHANESNADSLFQVASQFNLLEMVSPNVTPERGVGIYENDRTQGPACAVAAGAGTIYRNYFAIVNGQTGQSARNQIDCLADIGAALGNSQSRLCEYLTSPLVSNIWFNGIRRHIIPRATKIRLKV